MSYNNATVLVTGADGFIGSHLVERLVAEGAKVTALALYNAFDGNGWLDDLEPETRETVTIARGDVRDGAFMMRLCENQDLIFHLAALIAIPHSYAAAQSYVETNVTGMVNLLEAARHHRPKRVVVTSTSEVYGTARTLPIGEGHALQGQSPYSASKIGADMMAQAYALSFDLPVAVLRPFNTYGPRQSERAVTASTIRQALDPDCAEIKVGDLTPTRDFTFVTDTADAFAALGVARDINYGEPYNAGSGRNVSIGEVVDEIRALTGTDKPVAVEEARLRPDKSEVRALLADSSRLNEATGWQAKTSLTDGLTQTVAWWRARLQRGKVRVGHDFVA